jgi:hypothetical protein
MSVSNRRREKKNALETLVRTFFQRYDDGTGSKQDPISVLRKLPMGSLAAFFAEQALWRTQRNLFGITLTELSRLVEAARSEAAALRQSMTALEAELESVRAAVRSSDGATKS